MNVPGGLLDAAAGAPVTARIVAVLFLALAAGTAFRGAALLRRPSPRTRERWRSLGTWWLLLALLVVILASGRVAATVVFAAVSLLGLREGVRLAGVPRLFGGLAAVAVGLYAWAWLDWRPLFTRLLPALVALLAVAEVAWRWKPREELSRARSAALAFAAAVIGPSFVVAAASLPPASVEGAAPLGWFVLLVLLTELNDIAQALWGRRVGARRLAPELSPGKTWEGLAGGVATTVAAAVLLAPTVTSYGRRPPPGLEEWGPPWLWSALLGTVVAVVGLGGDLLVSSLKRRAGVKDSGTLLPGHGGVLDRVDSLAATAPTFFLLTWVLWMGR